MSTLLKADFVRATNERGRQRRVRRGSSLREEFTPSESPILLALGPATWKNAEPLIVERFSGVRSGPVPAPIGG